MKMINDKKYIKLCLMLVLVAVIYVLLLGVALFINVGVDCYLFFVYALFWPVVSVLYGIKSYLYTRKTFEPLLILFVLFIIIILVFRCSLLFLGSGDILENTLLGGISRVLAAAFLSQLIVFPISLVVSLISSLITKKMVRSKAG